MWCSRPSLPSCCCLRWGPAGGLVTTRSIQTNSSAKMTQVSHPSMRQSITFFLLDSAMICYGYDVANNQKRFSEQFYLDKLCACVARSVLCQYTKSDQIPIYNLRIISLSICVDIIHSFIFSSCFSLVRDRSRFQEHCARAQDRNAPWMGRQASCMHMFKPKGAITIDKAIYLNVFRLLEESREPGANPHGHRQKMQNFKHIDNEWHISSSFFSPRYTVILTSITLTAMYEKLENTIFDLGTSGLLSCCQFL